MTKFSDILSAIGLAPKTLDQAKSTISTAKPALDSVAALFTSAGLDLDTMLSAGPDSLKAHLAGLSAKDSELAEAQSKIAGFETQALAHAGAIEKFTAEAKALADSINAANTAIGHDPKSDGADFGKSLSAHVAKEAALILAKDGRPPLTQANIKAPAGNQMSRSSFDALAPRAQSDFCRSGGRISDDIKAS